VTFLVEKQRIGLDTVIDAGGNSANSFGRPPPMPSFNDTKVIKKGEGKMHYSVKNLKGYAVGATDGDIGKVDDFYFGDDF
jgi:hypothetical protein